MIILIATPEEYAKGHLEVMATITQMMSEPEVRAKLFTAQSPTEAYEAIEMESRHDYNYFLEGED